MPDVTENIILRGYRLTGGGEQLITTDGYSPGVIIPIVGDGRGEILILQGMAIHAPDALHQRIVTQGYGGVVTVTPTPTTATDVQVLTVAFDVQVTVPDYDLEVLR